MEIIIPEKEVKTVPKMTDREADLRDAIIEIIEERYGTKFAFCKKTGIGADVFSKWESGKTITVKKMCEICDLLKIKWGDLDWIDE